MQGTAQEIVKDALKCPVKLMHWKELGLKDIFCQIVQFMYWRGRELAGLQVSYCRNLIASVHSTISTRDLVTATMFCLPTITRASKNFGSEALGYGFHVCIWKTVRKSRWGGEAGILFG